MLAEIEKCFLERLASAKHSISATSSVVFSQNGALFYVEPLKNGFKSSCAMFGNSEGSKGENVNENEFLRGYV
ncbi:27422_t:CDS:2 [Gigaspora margarita]|uniref:27422_t:CDS:1 n=1 Tax=Gigaspora margarita TaxID=4874 RepID=A0ABN7UUM0_GIGMA|nr:27422_t:CDS:2 [Gigaspora margarita]